MLTLKETFDYAKILIKAKKEISKLVQSDEMIVLLYDEIERLNEKCISLQEEVIYYTSR